MALSIDPDVKQRIERRLGDFREFYRRSSEMDIFSELVFCILTPQAKARKAEEAVNTLIEKGWIWDGSVEELSSVFQGVRFRNQKALSVVSARKTVSKNGQPALKAILTELKDPERMREWLVDHIRGMSWKEAGHFLRNTGICFEFAILDRHVIRFLLENGVIDREPSSLGQKNYLEIEKKMRGFALKNEIPMGVLDFWVLYSAIGDIFK